MKEYGVERGKGRRDKRSESEIQLGRDGESERSRG